MNSLRLLLPLVLALLTSSSNAEERPAGMPAGYRLLYSQSFDDPEALKDFAMTDSTAWRRATTNDVRALELVRQSKYKPAVRSPVNMALIAEHEFKDFIL